MLSEPVVEQKTNGSVRASTFRYFARCTFPYSSAAIQSLVPDSTGRLLDIGCGKGEFLSQVKGVRERYGCDLDPNMIDMAKNMVANGVFFTVGVDAQIPFPDGWFDVVTLLSVLEHVPDERAILGEVQRVLRPGGRLIVLVPHKGLFSFADIGNLKFRFPRLHKKVHLRLLGTSRVEYGMKFEKQAGNLLVGCHSNQWHVHYSKAEVETLLAPWFQIEYMFGFCLFRPILEVLDAGVGVLLKHPSNLVRRMIRKLIQWDYSLQPGRFSEHLIAVGEKKF